MKLIDGKATAAAIRAEIKDQVTAITAAGGRAPGLAVVLAGQDPASQIYVRNKIQACADTGVRSFEHRPDENISQAELEALIDTLNADPAVDGVLVQLPLPKHLDSQAILDRIDPAKDVDGFHPANMGKLTLGLPGLTPCTPSGCMELLKRYGISVSGKKAVVIGRSNIVGKPMALMLLAASATVTICHSRTPDLAEELKDADIVVAAVGVAKLVGPGMVKPGAVILDVGMNRDENGKLCGDVDFEGLKDVAAAMTPVPGGVGPMTIAMLLANTVAAYRSTTSG